MRAQLKMHCSLPCMGLLRTHNYMQHLCTFKFHDIENMLLVLNDIDDSCEGIIDFRYASMSHHVTGEELFKGITDLGTDTPTIYVLRNLHSALELIYADDIKGLNSFLGRLSQWLYANPFIIIMAPTYRPNPAVLTGLTVHSHLVLEFTEDKVYVQKTRDGRITQCVWQTEKE